MANESYANLSQCSVRDNINSNHKTMAPYSLYSLRRRWQRPLAFRNAMYPILATLLVVHVFWIFYDITITSYEHHRPKRRSVQVTESSPLSPFYPPSPGMEYDGFARAFPVWRNNHFPCGLLEDKYTMRTRTPATEGFFYVKEVEASDVMFSSVTARIARNMGRRQQQQQITNNNDMHKHNNTTANVCTTRLVSQRARRFRDRTRDKSFLWSVVREPVGRLLSKYYHYGQVATTRISKRGTPLSRFQNYVFNSENQDYGYYFRSLGVDRKFNPYKKEHEADSRELLESYDFLGVSERMDESLAVLKIILNLDIQDVLYLTIAKATSSSKNTNGALIDSSNVDYYENWGKECRAIPKPEITLAMKEWFHSEEFEAFIEADVIFYKAVNASLDKTIAELGRDLVEKTVKQIRWAQKVVEEKCQNVRFPCSSEGELQKETDCLFSNIGCGYNCLDELGETLSQDPGFQTL